MADGKPIKQSLMDAGYSEAYASRGKAAISKGLVAALAKEGVKYAELGKQLDPAHVEHAIAGRLYANMITGDNAGNESAKLLGTMRKHNLFQADSMTGVIVLAAPNITPAGKPLNAVSESDLLDGEIVEPKQLTE